MVLLVVYGTLSGGDNELNPNAMSRLPAAGIL